MGRRKYKKSDIYVILLGNNGQNSIYYNLGKYLTFFMKFTKIIYQSISL